jgi:energy-coupling factor transporter transmembrane protein EcfT
LIPSSHQAWRPVDRLPLAGLHPAALLGAGALMVLSVLLLPAIALVPLGGLLVWLLGRAGWRPRYALRLVRMWSLLLLVVLLAHTLSAADATPLGHPSWTGFGRGLIALVRLAGMLTVAALVRRLLPLPALTAALSWWLRPLRWLGVRTEHLNLVLAIAVSTAPRTLAEAQRLQACLRLRRADGRPRRRRLHLRERWLVVPPLMESLVRRAEALPLAVAGRVAAAPGRPRPVPVAQLGALVLWTVLLTLAVR